MVHHSLRRQTSGASELHRASAEIDSAQAREEDKVKLPKRSDKGRYNDQAGLRGMTFVAERY